MSKWFVSTATNRRRVRNQQGKIRLLICGDREWKKKDRIRRELLLLGISNIEVVIHGAARGADSLGAEVAEELGINKRRIKPFPAKWEEQGKAAGVIRNSQMLKEGRPTYVLAFHSHLKTQSKGTADMVRKAKAVGIEVKVIK